MGTAVALDKSYLVFSDVTLKVYSDAVPVTAVDDYHLNAQINGNVTQTHSGTAVHATAVQMRVGLTAVLLNRPRLLATWLGGMT